MYLFNFLSLVVILFSFSLSNSEVQYISLSVEKIYGKEESILVTQSFEHDTDFFSFVFFNKNDFLKGGMKNFSFSIQEIFPKENTTKELFSCKSNKQFSGMIEDHGFFILDKYLKISFIYNGETEEGSFTDIEGKLFFAGDEMKRGETFCATEVKSYEFKAKSFELFPAFGGAHEIEFTIINNNKSTTQIPSKFTFYSNMQELRSFYPIRNNSQFSYVFFMNSYKKDLGAVSIENYKDALATIKITSCFFQPEEPVGNFKKINVKLAYWPLSEKDNFLFKLPIESAKIKNVFLTMGIDSDSTTIQLLKEKKAGDYEIVSEKISSSYGEVSFTNLNLDTSFHYFVNIINTKQKIFEFRGYSFIEDEEHHSFTLTKKSYHLKNEEYISLPLLSGTKSINYLLETSSFSKEASFEVFGQTKILFNVKGFQNLNDSLSIKDGSSNPPFAFLLFNHGASSISASMELTIFLKETSPINYFLVSICSLIVFLLLVCLICTPILVFVFFVTASCIMKIINDAKKNNKMFSYERITEYSGFETKLEQPINK